jgi:hypothetical protein
MDDEDFTAAEAIAERGFYSDDDPRGADIILLAMTLLALRKRVVELETKLGIGDDAIAHYVNGKPMTRKQYREMEDETIRLNLGWKVCPKCGSMQRQDINEPCMCGTPADRFVIKEKVG